MTLSPHLMTIHWIAPGGLRRLPDRFMPSLISLTASLARYGHRGTEPMVPRSGRSARSRTKARTREPTEIKVPEGTTMDIRTERI
jgi:hypothetical protein